MFRFTIRDVLWLTVVLAFAVCWYLERDGRIDETDHIRSIFRENESLKEHVRELEAAIFRAEAAARPAVHPPIVGSGSDPTLAD
jgi:hypothetical protein